MKKFKLSNLSWTDRIYLPLLIIYLIYGLINVIQYESSGEPIFLPVTARIYHLVLIMLVLLAWVFNIIEKKLKNKMAQ